MSATTTEKTAVSAVVYVKTTTPVTVKGWRWTFPAAAVTTTRPRTTTTTVTADLRQPAVPVVVTNANSAGIGPRSPVTSWTNWKRRLVGPIIRTCSPGEFFSLQFLYFSRRYLTHRSTLLRILSLKQFLFHNWKILLKNKHGPTSREEVHPNNASPRSSKAIFDFQFFLDKFKIRESDESGTPGPPVNL